MRTSTRSAANWSCITPRLLEKPQLVAANKIDAVDDPARVTALEKRAKKLKLKFFEISAVTGQGTKELIEAAWPIIARGRELDAKAIELEIEDDDEREAPADYNPALVAPLSRGPRKAQTNPGPQKAQNKPGPQKAQKALRVQKAKRRR